jgi:hypothetical protein
MSDAPFVLAGDTILSNVSLGGGLASVLVERLSGTERNVFSLYKLNQHFPAEPAPWYMDAPLPSQTAPRPPS